MPNKTFLRAASLLCHPLSIAAMLVLLFNDHWLRWYAPSWWTGKLGDFAWLFFAPFAAAMILAVLIPSSPRQEKIVPALAFGLIGGIFALAKTAPLVHAFIAQIAEMILRVPIGLRRDPSDLIALASLGAAWWLWRRHTTTAHTAVASGLIALLLAATLTLANGPMPDYGITEFQLSGDALIARSTLGAWKSTDGGLTWEQMNAQEVKSPGLFATTWGVQRTAIVTDTLNANVLYRVTPLAAIERSEDRGKMWRVDFAVTHLSEAARAYADRKQRYGFTPGPVGGIVDPQSGNAIFAMAHEGALVRKPSDEYVWAAVGPHQRIALGNPMDLLSGELLLAFGMGLLILATQTTRVLSIKHWSRYILAALAWLAWLVDSVIFPPGRANGQYGVGIAQMAAVGTLAVISLITLIIVLIGRWRALRTVGVGYVAALFAVPLYFAPYYLWALNLIPNYVAAMLFAFALSAVMVIVGWIILNRIAPTTQAVPQKANDDNSKAQ